MSNKPQVKNPKHYRLRGLSLQAIDIIQASAKSAEDFKEHCRLTALKYVLRANKKGDRKTNLKKAQVYLEWAINGRKTDKPKKTDADMVKELLY